MTTPRFFLRAKFVGAITTAIVIMWSASVSAGILTLHFPDDLADPTCDLGCNHNTTADGFRISPANFYQTTVVCCGFLVVPALSWDDSPQPNPDYLGPPPNPGIGIYMDHDGLPFDLLSIETLNGPLFAESSKGGLAITPVPPFVPGMVPTGRFDFVGPEWSNIQWVRFSYGAPAIPIAGFDELVVFVPGPPTLGLFGLGILLLGMAFAKKVTMSPD
jgi:hypothetical protein